LVENFWKKNLDEKIILEWILKTGWDRMDSGGSFQHKNEFCFYYMWGIYWPAIKYSRRLTYMDLVVHKFITATLRDALLWTVRMSVQ
jgi:hypothetical protein